MSIKKKPSPKKAKNSNTKKTVAKSTQPVSAIKEETKKEIVPPKIADLKTEKVKVGRKGTQYLFNGETYGKGKLVLAVVKAHVSKFPKSTLKDLQKTFPKEIQKYYEVVESLVVAKKKSEHYPRYFVKDNQPIKIADGSIGVTTQWGDNIKSFLEVAKKLGFTIKETK